MIFEFALLGMKSGKSSQRVKGTQKALETPDKARMVEERERVFLRVIIAPFHGSNEDFHSFRASFCASRERAAKSIFFPFLRPG
jgi:hypothetical protein